MRWLTKHLELKIVALVMAVAVWSYTRGQSRTEITVPVLIDPQAVILPPGQSLAGVDWREFRIVLSVPREELPNVPPLIEPDRIYLRRESVSDQRIVVPVTSRMLGLDPDWRLMRTEPEGAGSLIVRLSATASAR